MTAQTSRRERAIARYSEQQAWFEEHGASEAAYVARYGSVNDPEHYGDGGEAIYAADKAAFDAAQSEALSVIRAARKVA